MTADDVRDELAEELEHAHWCNSNYPGKPGCDCLDYRLRQADALLPVVYRIAREAYEEGRASVGLGDFVIEACGAEHEVPRGWEDQYGYDPLECTRGSGHADEHEHELSGLTWFSKDGQTFTGINP